MGLEIYFNSVKNSENNTRSENLTKLRNGTDINVKVHFRRVNFLITYFKYTDCSVYRKVLKTEIDDVITRCENVLKSKKMKTSRKLLPNTSPGGFWYWGKWRRVKLK